METGVKVVIGYQLTKKFFICNVTNNKIYISAFYIVSTGTIIQTIDSDYFITWILFGPIINKVGSNESTSSSY
jgi:hypothetical protein